MGSKGKSKESPWTHGTCGRDGEVRKEFVKVGVAFERPSEEGMVLKLSAHSITGEYLIVSPDKDSQEAQ